MPSTSREYLYPLLKQLMAEINQENVLSNRLRLLQILIEKLDSFFTTIFHPSFFNNNTENLIQFTKSTIDKIDRIMIYRIDHTFRHMCLQLRMKMIQNIENIQMIQNI